jgi:hypothetical protein
MMRYDEEMVNAGVTLAGDGLKPSATGARIRFSGGKPVVADGPFAEAKELVAGFTIIQVGAREEAPAWVKGWPASDGDGAVELELRELDEAVDFGVDCAPEIRRVEESLRARDAEQR